jgi:hypothetical protein
MDGHVVEPIIDPDIDEHAWLLQQAHVLRARRLTSLDIENVAEFLESMARKDVREMASRFRILYAHLVKFQVQPERAGRSWAVSVINSQHALAEFIDAPSLRCEAEARLPEIWETACKIASIETGLPRSALPRRNPWTLDEAMAWDPPESLATLRPRRKKK